MTTNDLDRITVIDIMIYLRQQLLNAIEQNDKETLRNLAVVFGMLWDLVDRKKIQGRIGRILENFERSAYDHIQGVGWKSIIPSEEEIRLALQGEAD